MTVEAIGELTHAVADRRNELVTLTRELVQAPSVVGAEEAAQTIMEDRLTALGFAVTRVRLADHVDPDDNTAGYPPLPAADRSCVVGTFPGSGHAPAVHLSGHIDVVPVEDAERWSADPFSGRVSDGRVWGRGAGDMKGGLAAYLIAAAAYLDVFGSPPGDLVFSSVLEEECGGNGMKAVLAAGYHGDATLIGEPSGLRLQHAGVGVVWARVTVRGAGSHPAFADGPSPSASLLTVLTALGDLEQHLSDHAGDRFFHEHLARPYRLTVGQLGGGVWPSSEPTTVAARVRLGFGRDLTPAQAQRRIAQTVLAACPEATVEFEGFRAPAYCHDLDHDLGRALTRAHREVTGDVPARRVLGGTTDARSVPGACVCYGPVAGNIHSIDEWVDITSMVQTAQVVALTLRQLQHGEA
ncbi:M20/M25/M40 family metallo-hydrolase [Dactylosporangium sucinum]|uniref:Acetylornithine deacetylase n=1 Tax=Dactylosporangium sucinum TaxID=1424081 RepID=A0A917X5H1_9ACTN|nr:M20/M25/M40 family metallo-hydrolase [Dactylosporangium sucinum]GGM69749.1 acetylornithine deacetylase [Dactylosporangium sucinum]